MAFPRVFYQIPGVSVTGGITIRADTEKGREEFRYPLPHCRPYPVPHCTETYLFQNSLYVTLPQMLPEMPEKKY